MVLLNVSSVVTKALSKVVDTSDELRAKFIIWFNLIARDIFNQPRHWAFLEASATITIASNQITLPTGAAQIVSMQIGDVFLTKENQINEIEAFESQESSDTIPAGYTFKPSTGIITFYPGANGDCLLTYETETTTDYTDTATSTIFPHELENLFLTGLNMHNYDYDKDGRYSKEVSLYQYEMSKVKQWDNRNKPKPEFNGRGYTRTKT